MKKTNVKLLTQSAMIAAIYVVLTYLASILGLASGVIQVRFSEALTILPYFTFAAVPGLFIGCLLSNILTGCAVWDVVFGSIATLLGAIGTRLIKDKSPYLAPIPPILANVLIVPIVLMKVYGVEDSWGFLCLTVGIGEVISCAVLGLILLFALKKHSKELFK